MCGHGGKPVMMKAVITYQCFNEFEFELSGYCYIAECEYKVRNLGVKLHHECLHQERSFISCLSSF